jgi:hypothetical protein
VFEVIRALKNNKAQGEDNISAELSTEVWNCGKKFLP